MIVLLAVRARLETKGTEKKEFHFTRTKTKPGTKKRTENNKQINKKQKKLSDYIHGTVFLARHSQYRDDSTLFYNHRIIFCSSNQISGQVRDVFLGRV